MDNYCDRTFQNPDDFITGKSVVIERDQRNNHSVPVPPKPFPYSMSDYLQNFIGKTIQVKYVQSNGRYCEQQGELIVAGSNFIGIQPTATDNLFILETNSIWSLNVLNYKKTPHNCRFY